VTTAPFPNPTDKNSFRPLGTDKLPDEQRFEGNPDLEFQTWRIGV
jgi:hypothetical protein